MKLAQDEQCKGFLLTCQQNREKQAIKDAYNFLNEYIEKLYPELDASENASSLKDELQKLQKKRVLYNIDTQVKCCIFVKINPEYQIDPCHVVMSIMDDMKNDRQLTRYCHRITPVEKAFRAEYFRMRDAVEELLSQKTRGQKKSWALNFKCRNNDKFKYKEVLATVNEICNNFGHFSDIYYPEWTICIEVNHHLMCVSIVEKFKEFNEYKLKKINVQAVFVKPTEEQQEIPKELPKKEQISRKDEELDKPACEMPVSTSLLKEEIKRKEDDVDLF